MRVLDLEKELEKIGIPSSKYSIMIGGLPNEKLCIVKEDKWQVYYSERGRKSGLKIFEEEADACKYFYTLLQKYSQ